MYVYHAILKFLEYQKFHAFLNYFQEISYITTQNYSFYNKDS